MSAGSRLIQLWPFYHSALGTHLVDWFPDGFAQFRHSHDEILRRVRSKGEQQLASDMIEAFVTLNEIIADGQPVPQPQPEEGARTGPQRSRSASPGTPPRPRTNPKPAPPSDAEEAHVRADANSDCVTSNRGDSCEGSAHSW